jgi:translation initiation factor IF-1
MPKQQQYEVDGVVKRVMGNNNYLVQVTTEGGRSGEVICHLAGKMRQYKINVTVGDTVRVVLPPPFDKGRITFRDRK